MRLMFAVPAKRTLFLVLLVCATATAATDVSAGDDAIAAFERGKALFNEEKYDEAAAAFRKANELRPSWKMLFNIGQCEAAAKRHGLALQSFETYLSKGGDDIPPDRRQVVIAEVERLRKIVGYVKVIAPDGARVYLDGVELGTTPLYMEFPVAVGVPHVITAVLSGKELPSETVQVTGGKTANVEIKHTTAGATPASATASSDETEPVAEPPEPAEASTTPGEEVDEAAGKKSKLRVWGWTSAGVGAALLIGGSVTGGVALSKNGEIDENCPSGNCPPEYEDTLKSRDTLATTTNILLGVGGAAMVTGVVLLIVSRGDEEAEPPLTVGLGAGDTARGVTVGRRF